MCVEKSLNIPLYALLVTALGTVVLPGCSSSSEVSRLQAIERTRSWQRSSAGPIDKADNAPSGEKSGATVIHPGDQIQVKVWDYPEFGTTANVSEDGTVVVPLVGEIQAAKLTKEDFAERVKSHLQQYIKEDPKVTVSILNQVSAKVSVMGAVNKQGNYPLIGDAALVEILSSAGGATPEADLSHVTIYRNGATSNAIEVDLTRHMQLGDMESIPRVRSGDTVFIPREENLVRGLSDFVRDALVVFGFFRILD